MNSVKPKISIIVPVYKAEKYLNRCIDSLLVQTYTDLEIILIDDGTPPTDKSPQICDTYAEKDGRIKVIHKENGGVSSARNAGLDIASGDYIMFVDSDDWIIPNYCEYMLHTAQQTQSDVVCSGYQIIYESASRDSEDSVIVEKDLTDSSAVVRNYYQSEFYVWTVWAKLYARQLLKTARFDCNLKYSEDYKFNREIFHKANRCSVRELHGYIWYKNSGSATASKSLRNQFDTLKSLKESLALCQQECPDEAVHIYGHIHHYCFMQYVRLAGITTSKEEFQRSKAELEQYVRLIFPYLKTIRIRSRVWIYAFYHCFPLAKILWKIRTARNHQYQ